MDRMTSTPQDRAREALETTFGRPMRSVMPEQTATCVVVAMLAFAIKERAQAIEQAAIIADQHGGDVIAAAIRERLTGEGE